MSPRAVLMGLLVLAALAAPTALAETDEAWATVDKVLDDANLPHPQEDPVATLTITAEAVLAQWLTQPATHEQDDAPPHHGASHSPEPDHDEAPPRDHGDGASSPWSLGPGIIDASSRVVIEKAPLVANLVGATGLGAATDLLPTEDAPAPSSAPLASGPSAAPAPAGSGQPAQETVITGPSATMVALASAAAVAGTLAAPGLDWDRFRRFGLFALLYTRIAKDRLLDHGGRETLLNAARERPGSTLSELADAAGIPRNTATYHLNRLEREGLVTSARKGRTRLYFTVGGEARKSQADAFAALRHDKGRALARAVGETPGIDQQALCAKVGLTPSLAHWHADRLVASGVIRKEREGRHVHYHPGPSFALVASIDAGHNNPGGPSDVPPMAC